MGKFFEVLIKLVPFIFSLVKAAEVTFSDSGTGAEKKAAVKEGLSSMFLGAKEASTGGQKETFEQVEPLFGSVVDKGIDLAAAMLFEKKKK